MQFFADNSKYFKDVKVQTLVAFTVGLLCAVASLVCLGAGIYFTYSAINISVTKTHFVSTICHNHGIARTEIQPGIWGYIHRYYTVSYNTAAQKNVTSVTSDYLVYPIAHDSLTCYYNKDNVKLVRLDNQEGLLERHAIYSAVLYSLVLIFLAVVLSMIVMSIVDKIKEKKESSSETALETEYTKVVNEE
eukprot:gene4060-7349_t